MREYWDRGDAFFKSTDYQYADDDVPNVMRNFDALRHCFLRRPLFRRLVEVFGDVHGLEGCVMLKAHGNTNRRNGRWKFDDGKRIYDMQHWIDRIDGQVSTILLFSCNPDNLDIRSERSVVIHPRDSVNVQELIGGRFLRLHVPGVGYVGDDYRKLRRTINDLEAMC